MGAIETLITDPRGVRTGDAEATRVSSVQNTKLESQFNSPPPDVESTRIGHRRTHATNARMAVATTAITSRRSLVLKGSRFLLFAKDPSASILAEDAGGRGYLGTKRR